jgi:hypothetical protein
MALTSAALRPNDASFANSQSAYSDYYKAFANNYDMTGWPSWRSNEHTSIMNFVPRSGATKVFCPRSGATNVNSGNWNVASNWWPNGVPAANDKVVIGEGVTCTYDIVSGSPDLTWLRQDGTLFFPDNANAHLLVDTWVSTESGSVLMGSAASRVQDDKVINIEFSAARGWIDVVADTFKQSRGAIWMGKSESGGATRIWGAEKTHALRVASHTGPLSGASSLTLESSPSNWRIGDQLQLGWTSNAYGFAANTDRVRFKENLVTITAINGAIITFTPALTLNFNAPVSPWVDQQPKAWVRNLTRNVRFSTRNASTTVVEQWAHTMFMHTNDVICEFASFNNMGRTVKLLHTKMQANATTAANSPMALGGHYFSGGALNLPTEGWLVATIYGDTTAGSTLTVTGEDARGNAMSETVTFAAGGTFGSGARTAYTTPWHMNDTGVARTEKFFKKITSVVASTQTVGDYSWTHHTRSFRMTGSGVRIPRGGGRDDQSGTWVYEPVNPGTNIQGRYSFHVHRGGSNIAEMRVNGTARGCVVSGSKGWGYAHHDTHFSFIDCIAHNVGGAGFVGERGSETGVWEGCHVSMVEGWDTGKPDFTPGWGDPASQGSAFWWAGRAIGANDCVADNAPYGYTFNARFAEALSVHTDEQLDIPEAYRGRSPNIEASSPHIQSFKNNEAFAVNNGLNIIKANPLQHTTLRTMIDGLFVWSCEGGMNAEYTAHYTWLNCTVIYGFITNRSGIVYGMEIVSNLSTDHVWIRPRVSAPPAGYTQFNAIGLNHGHFGNVVENDPRQTRIVVDADLNGGNIGDYKPAIDRLISSSSYPALNPPVSIDLSAVHPTPGSVSKTLLYPVSQPPFTNGYNGWRTSGPGLVNFIDRLSVVGVDKHPLGVPTGYQEDWVDVASDSEMNGIVRRDGFRVNTVDSQKYVFVDEIFLDRVTGEVFKDVIPCNYNTYGGSENRGSTTLTNNTKPTASAFSVNCLKDGSLQIAPLANAGHPNSRQIMLRGNTQPRWGFVVRDGFSTTSSGSGTLTYIPQRGFTGTDSFKYWIMDQDGNISDTRGHTITVNVSATAPTFQANPDSATAAYETPVAFNVLTNDVGTGLTVVGSAVTSGGGSVGHVSGGTVTYTPASGFTGTATGTATVRDGALSEQTSTWSVFVSAPGSPPPSLLPPVVADPITLRIRKDRMYAINAAAGSSDPQGGPLTFGGWTSSDIAKATVIDAAGTVVYFRADQTGSVTLNLALSNSAQLSTNRVVNLVVTDRGRRFGVTR